MKWLLILVILFGAVDAAPPRVVRHKIKKLSSHRQPLANTEEETDTHSNANCFAKTKESFADSIANPDAEEQIKAQKSISYSHTERIPVGNRDSVCESGGNTRSRLEEKRAGRMLHFRLTKLRATTAIRQKFAKSWTPGSR